VASEKRFTVVIAGDDRTGHAFRSAESGMSKLGHAAANVGKAVALGVGALAVGGVALGKQLYDAAIESQKVTKQTEAVIKSMGNASNISADQVAKLSTKLSNKTAIDDELIQSGANVLLTFGKVRNEVGKGNDIFTRATSAALDMSVALGTDMKGASIQIGKALNDPIKGLTALSRAGVSFTQEQKDTVKAMVFVGDTMGAQKLILSELDKQFAGSAASQATGLDKLKVTWGNFQEQLGERLIPIVEKVVGWLGDKLPGAFAFLDKVIGEIIGGFRAFGAAFKIADGDITSSGFPGFMERVGYVARVVFDEIKKKVEEWGPVVLGAFQAVARFITERFVPALVSIASWIIEHKPVLLALGIAVGVVLTAAFLSWAAAAAAAAAATIAAAAPVVALGLVIGALVSGIIWAYQNWNWFRDAIDAVARFITDTLVPAFQAVWRFIADKVIPVVSDLIGFWWNMVEAVGGVYAAITLKFLDLVGFISRLPGDIARAAKGIWDGITDGVEAAVRWVLEQLDRMLGPLDEIAGKVAGLFGGSAEDAVRNRILAKGGSVPRRALGGPVLAGSPYIVGERGPELFVPGMSGSIVPNGVGHTTYQIDVRVAPGSEAEAGRQIVEAIRVFEARNGQGWRS
jgi:hypothetical protein